MERTNQDAAHMIRQIIMKADITKEDKIDLLEFIQSWYNATKYEFDFMDNSKRLEDDYIDIQQ